MSDLRLLEHFVAVYRNGSYRSAADQLGVTQSTVTKRIQSLESQLGMRLFNRTTRAVEPSDTARSLIDHAEATLKAASAFDDEARLMAGGDHGGIRVGAIALAAETLIVGGLVRLSESHPNLDVDVIVGSSDIYKDLVTGECDLIVGDLANFKSSTYATSLRMERLNDEPLVFVHRKNHPVARSKLLAELLRYPLAIPSRYFNENRLFETLAKETGPATSPRYRLNSLSACISLAASSDVITLAPKSLVEQFSHAGNQHAIAVANFDTGIELNMVLVTVARNVPSPAMRAFREALLLQ